MCVMMAAGAAEPRLVEGTRYSDVIDESASDVPVEIYGLRGKDTITGSGYGDTIDGGPGNDSITAGDGDDVVVVTGADGGIDIVDGGPGIDRILGGSGDDSIGFNRVFGGTRSVEIIDGAAGFNQILGTKYVDDLDFSSTTLVNVSIISGLAGNDSLTGSGGPDTIEGGPDNDSIYGLAGDDTFLVNGLNADFDLVRGGDGQDRILGSSGDDLIGLRGYSGANTVELIDGGGGYDVIVGSAYADLLDFSTTTLRGIALIEGGGGNDSIVGTAMDDQIAGGEDNDTIDGGIGFDTAVFGGLRAEYEVYVGETSATVIRIVAGGSNETDTLLRVEQARFADMVIPIGSGNQPPTAVDDALVGEEDTEKLYPESALLANDSDPDGDPIHVVSLTAIRGGQVELMETGEVRFQPDPDFNGEATFSYVVEDDKGGSRSASVIVNVASVNDPPIALDDSLVVEIDTTLSFGASQLLINDSDVDEDELVVVGVDNAINGTVNLSADQISFSPDPDFVGQAQFRYEVDDQAGDRATATVHIEVREPNGIPTAADDSVILAEDETLSLLPDELLANDDDPDGDQIDVVDLKNAVNGVVSWQSNGAIAFQPTADFWGTAEFTYVISDGKDQTEAVVTIDVTPVNDPPVAGPDTFTGNLNSEIIFEPGQLLVNDIDVDGDPLGISAVGDPANCSVSLDEFGRVVFIPDQDFQGVATFGYTVDDGAGGLAFGSVTVNVGFSFRIVANNKSTSILQWDGLTREFLGVLVARPKDTINPHSVTMGPDGQLYVGWTGNSRAPASVRKHDAITGEPLGIFSTFEMESDDTGEALTTLAFARNGQLLVMDNKGLDPDHKMFRFQGLDEPNPGAFVDEFITNDEYQFGSFKVGDIDFDSQGNLLLPSAAKHEIVLFEGPEIGGGKSRILDMFVSAFCYQDRDDGIFRRIPGCYSNPDETGFNSSTMTEGYGLGWGPDGNLYVSARDAPEKYGRIMTFSADGKFLGNFVSTAEYSAITTSQPRDLDFGPDGNLYVTNNKYNGVLIFGGPTGPNAGQHIGTLTAPDGVKFTGSTSIEFIVDD